MKMLTRRLRTYEERQRRESRLRGGKLKRLMRRKRSPPRVLLMKAKKKTITKTIMASVNSSKKD